MSKLLEDRLILYLYENLMSIGGFKLSLGQNFSNGSKVPIQKLSSPQSLCGQSRDYST
jgi:hypothetical protein